MKRILIVGASGFLGSHLAVHLRARYQVYGTFHRTPPEVDRVPSIRFPLFPGADIPKLVRLIRPDVIFYCAEVTGDTQANEDPLGTLYINGEAPAQLADAVAKTGGHLVHFSTPRIFSGEKGQYEPTDPPSPTGIYGKTKAQGERSLHQRENARILRVGALYGWGPASRRNFLRLALNACRQPKQHPLETGPRLSFDYVGDVVAKAEDFMEYGEPVIHLTSGTRESPYSFAEAVARTFGLGTSHFVPHAPDRAVQHRDWTLVPSPSPGPLRGLSDGLERLKAQARTGNH